MKLIYRSILFLMSVAFITGSTQVKAADYIGFENGNQVEAVEFAGKIKITCTYMRTFPAYVVDEYVDCRDWFMKPKTKDYFKGPKGIAATKVLLTATHENGEIKKKKSDYDSTNGRSKNTFNLWEDGVFQSPLLALGMNKIHYTFINSKKQIAQEGDFEVTVTGGAETQCRYREYSSFDLDSCDRDRLNFCVRYFLDPKNCAEKK